MAHKFTSVALKVRIDSPTKSTKRCTTPDTHTCRRVRSIESNWMGAIAAERKSLSGVLPLRGAHQTTAQALPLSPTTAASMVSNYRCLARSIIRKSVWIDTGVLGGRWSQRVASSRAHNTCFRSHQEKSKRGRVRTLEPCTRPRSMVLTVENEAAHRGAFHRACYAISARSAQTIIYIRPC